MTSIPDVIIIGAGISGLTAAIDLAKAGLRVVIFEARSRVGGRILTEHNPDSKFPIELGAEFVHGLPPEIWIPLQNERLEVTEFDGENWCFRKGKLSPCDFFGEVEKILKKMKPSSRDQSFLNFLERNFPNPKQEQKLEEAKFWARKYVSGFNAADPRDVSVNWLIQEQEAEEQVGGQRAFFINKGYSALVQSQLSTLRKLNVKIVLNSAIRNMRWSRHSVEIRGLRSNKNFKVNAPRVLITVPLGVLQAHPNDKGAMRFSPRLPLPKQHALQKLAMGHVLRITLQFKSRFWEKIRSGGSHDFKSLSDLSFLFSDDEWFPTWWTKMPGKAPLITGWAPFQCADKLAGRGRKFVINKALTALGQNLQRPLKDLKGMLKDVHYHDWQNDPFSRGAYSYVKVGGETAPEILARPVQQTLFFAGEATDINGQTGTVHGAIATGNRAAKQIIQG